MMTPEQAWQAALGQLQMEMPRASFDTWVRGTNFLSYENGVFKVGARNKYACDWLENRLLSTVSRLLAGMVNQAVEVRFVVDDQEPEDEGDNETDDESEDDNPGKPESLEIEAVWGSAYDQIVRPDRVIVVSAYFIRHLSILGPELGWMYIGFRQAAYSAGGRSGQRTGRFTGKTIATLSGSSERTFWNRAARKETWQRLTGLVSLLDEKPLWDEKSATPKRLPRKYSVAMTLPLTGADARALSSWIAEHIEQAEGPVGVLNAACKAPVDELLSKQKGNSEETGAITVHQIVHDLFSGEVPDKELDALAEKLHLHIMPPGDLIFITQFFVEHVLPHLGAGPGWMLTILRDRCWVDPETGVTRTNITIKGGYAEIAGWLGLDRPLTVYEWIAGKHRNFLPTKSESGKKPNPKAGQYLQPILRIYLQEVETGRVPEFNDGPREFEILINEIPTEILTDAIQGQENFTRFSECHYANFSIGFTRFAEENNANFSIEITRFAEELYATCRVFNLLNSLKPTLNNKTSTQPPKKSKSGKSDNSKADSGVEGGAHSEWDLDVLLQNNGVRASAQRKLKQNGASAQAFVSWLIYGASPAAENLKDRVGNAIARLIDSPQIGAGGACSLLAALPPLELKAALEKDLQGRMVSAPGYSIALKHASSDSKCELLQRLYGAQSVGGT